MRACVCVCVGGGGRQVGRSVYTAVVAKPPGFAPSEPRSVAVEVEGRVAPPAFEVLSRPTPPLASSSSSTSAGPPLTYTGEVRFRVACATASPGLVVRLTAVDEMGGELSGDGSGSAEGGGGGGLWPREVAVGDEVVWRRLGATSFRATAAAPGLVDSAEADARYVVIDVGKRVGLGLHCLFVFFSSLQGLLISCVLTTTC